MVRTLISAQQLQERISTLANQVAEDYTDQEQVFIGVLNGAAPFMVGLISRLPAQMQERLVYDFVAVSSYDGEVSRGQVRLNKGYVVDVQDRDVLVVEGIVDTGLTLERVLQVLRQDRPRSLRVCALLDKPSRRRREVPIDYCGFTIPDLFVVGFGMDHAQRFRALPFIGVVE